MNKFMAIDGEGYDLDGVHVYNMLCNNEGNAIQDDAGLDTLLCLDTILEWSREAKHLIGFSFDYDISMMLKDLPESCLDKLKLTNACNFRTEEHYYSLFYIPDKIFKIKKYLFDNPRAMQTAVITDVWGFFQSKFTTALKDWNINMETNAMIETFKEKRGNFTSAESEAVRDYCIAECRGLVQLMEALDNKLLQIGVKLRSYHGAGAIASQLFVKYKLAYALRKEDTTSVLSAYFGGRIECFRLGEFENVHAYDINSAYPYALTTCPYLYGDIQSYDVNEPILDHRIYRIKWSSGSSISPFPCRLKDGNVEYYNNGIGWYFGVEITAALSILDSYEILECQGYDTDYDQYPFQFIKQLYATRQAYKEMGDFAHIPLKLGYNSMYGKLAQRDSPYQKREPAYRSYYLAGYVTAKTRSMLLTASLQCPDSIIAIATDGIYSRAPLDLPVSKLLGEFEYERYDSGFFLKPGFYRLENADKEYIKTRGISKKFVDWNALKEAWLTWGINGCLECFEDKFVGFTSNNKEYNLWLKNHPKKLDFFPSRGEPQYEVDTGTYRMYPLEGDYFESCPKSTTR